VYAVENMTSQRMRLLLRWNSRKTDRGASSFWLGSAVRAAPFALVGFLASFLMIWTTLAVAQQVKKIDDQILKTAGKGTEWTMNGMDWGEQRYSTMTQINPGNVSKLASAWSYELGPGGGNQQATPVYSNGVLYTVTNWSIVAAVDAKTGKELWRYDPDADRTMTQPGKSRLCCGVNSRGLALYEGKLLVPVVDTDLVSSKKFTQEPVIVGGVTGTYAANYALGQSHVLTLTGAVAITPSNIPAGSILRVTLIATTNTPTFSGVSNPTSRPRASMTGNAG